MINNMPIIGNMDVEFLALVSPYRQATDHINEQQEFCQTYSPQVAESAPAIERLPFRMNKCSLFLLTTNNCYETNCD
jgi:hypothetical protein